MPRSLARRLAALLVVAPFLGLAGCGPDNPQLAKAPLVQIPEPKAPEEQPKNLRPGSGSSAGMNYDPSGVGGGPPPAAKNAAPPATPVKK
jgi:hypothetical protein